MDTVPAETLAAGKAYMRQLQRNAVKARWASFTPEARSAVMRRLALRRHKSSRRRQRAGKLNRTLLLTFQREFLPPWKPERLTRLRRELQVAQDRFSVMLGVRRSSVKRWEHAIQVPTRATQRLIWLLERTVRGQPTDLAALLTWGASDHYRSKGRRKRTETSMSGTVTTVQWKRSA